MKELSIEEKAKAYDDALERAKEWFKPEEPDSYTCIVESIFPELKESEDVGIREALIDGFKRYDDGSLFNGCLVREIIAWLEKQVEHARFIEAIQVGDQVTKNEDGVLVNLSQLKRVAKPSEQNQGEQKPDTDFSDLRTWKYIVDAVLTEREGIGQYLDSHFTEEVAKKLQKRFGNIEQKPAWSEEDKCMLNNVIDTLKPLSQTTHSGYSINSMIDWLKSLKGRVQLQPKQEWSEEEIENCAREAEDNNCIILAKHIRQLKSLRPQNTWKPSEEQIKLLREVQQALLGKDCHNRFVIFMHELKRLREEQL